MSEKAPLAWMEDCSVDLIGSTIQLQEWLDRGYLSERIGLDFETSSPNAWDCDLVGICLAWDGRTACYVPVGHLAGDELNLPMEETWEILRPIFKAKQIVVFNWGFEGVILPRFGVDSKNYRDMMPVVYLADMDSKKYNLKYGAERFLGLETMTIDMVPGIQVPQGKKKPLIKFALSHPHDAYWYGAQDALLTCRLQDELEPKVRAVQGTKGEPGLIVEVEIAIMEVLNEMNRNMVMLDTEHSVLVKVVSALPS